MKDHFHLIFAAALSLGTLIILNVGKSEETPRYADTFEKRAMELVAEIPGGRTTGFLFTVGIHHHEAAFESRSGSLRHLVLQDQLAQQVRSKTQKQIHLELKPILGIQAGQTIYRPLRYDPPPVC